MRAMSLSLALAAAVTVLAASAVEASSCYIVVNAKDAVVYRENTTPVDLSERGAAARDAMRERGELLMIVDTDECWPVAAAPSGQATVDEIVAGIRPAITASDAAAAARTGYRGIAAPSTPAGRGAPIMSGAPVVLAPRDVVGPATQTIPNAIRQNLQGGRGY